MKIDNETKELLGLLNRKDRELRELSTKYKSILKEIEEGYGRQIHDLSRLVADKDMELALLRASTSFKFGNACVRLMRGATGRGRSIARFPGPWTLSRYSPWHVRATYRKATQPSQLFNTVRSKLTKRPPGAEISEDLGILWYTLQSRREKAPRILDEFERNLLESYTEARSEGLSSQEQYLVRLIQAVLLDAGRTNAQSRRFGKGQLLVDARTLQGGRFDGTARHAAAVLESLLEHRDRWDGVTLLIDTEKGELPRWIAKDEVQVGFERVTPELIERASAFVQLQPFHDFQHGDVVDQLLMASWVRTATVWLDAIAGNYPYHFLTSPDSFFRYQWFIERIRHYDCVLPLSNSSKNEVAPLLAESQNVIVTACRNPLRSHLHRRKSWSESPTPELRVTLFGNALPHKNIAAGLLAFAYAHARYDGKLRLDVVANLTDGQVTFAKALLTSLDTALPSAVMFHRRLPDSRLAVLLANSNASIVPTLHEGFSLPILESFAFGVPVVASDVPAHRELLGPDYPLAPPEDPVVLGRHLLSALRDPAPLVARLKVAPVSRSEAQFNASLASLVESLSQPRRDEGK